MGNDDGYQQQQQSTMIIDQQQQQAHQLWTKEQLQALEQVLAMDDLERRIVTTAPTSTMSMATTTTGTSLSSLAYATATETAGTCRRNNKNNTKKEVLFLLKSNLTTKE